MKPSRLVLFLLLVLAMQGCMAWKFSSGLLDDMDDGEVENGLSDMTVAVEGKGTDMGWFFEDAAQDLRDAGIFREVYFVERVSDLPEPPDLVLTGYDINREKCFLEACSQPEPFLMVGTLGIIPNICENRDTKTFSLSSPSTGKTVRVSMEYEWRTVEGWWALYLKHFSGWISAKERQDRYLRAMRSAFQKRAQDVRQLLN